MKPIDISEIRSIEEYKKVRDDLQKRVISLKKYRRLFLGDMISLVFENRETMIWQIHEMIRVENITDKNAIKHECEVYSGLLPKKNELSATLYIEFPYGTNIREKLNKLLGIDTCINMYIDDNPIHAIFDNEQYSENRISSVHYIRFHINDDHIKLLKTSEAQVKIKINHKNYRTETIFTQETIRSLIQDLEDL